MTIFSSSWQSPSNIALVKYWGKKPGLQLPANASLSFTLDQAVTKTSVSLSDKQSEHLFDLDFSFEGKPNPKFEDKLVTFFTNILGEFPFLSSYRLHIQSSNTFPHSSGIASSASSMSALALCLCSLDEQVNQRPLDQFYRKVSETARIGSGSACRSVYGGLAMWGEHPDYPGSSDFYAIPVNQDIHQVFQTFHDTILIVEEGQKKVSSSVGHSLLQGHPFALQRYEVAFNHMSEIHNCLQNGDLEAFTLLVENEALMLHALMMTSNPAFILMKPNTLAIIGKIREFRSSTGIPACFTLDAGANVHLLYPDQNAIQVVEFVKNELVGYCENGLYFCNRIGNGPQSLQITNP